MAEFVPRFRLNCFPTSRDADTPPDFSADGSISLEQNEQVLALLRLGNEDEAA
jgi:hypothetical protein